ncbi:Uncharacterized protein dnl_27940 [Desulfonema limicola]|uniref:Endonuclease n=2 Tax=Desulfonema limicola TaxID=45656 RepID=A0A975GGQ0_9BACT|nr:Uncharacterized protein dnl_27940 [Desulfonema limicola]
MASKYDKIIEKVFFDNYSKTSKISFDREELALASKKLNIPRIKNLGDIVYSYRFRKDLPHTINETARTGCEWIIVGTGIGSYEFRLSQIAKIEPASNRQKIKIPDSTPEIVKMYAPANDEQALLTKVRYNRIIDLFMSMTCYSIQNHLRTTVNGIGQIEVDEIYLGINKNGIHFVFPCQAKSPGDKFGIVQVLQDISFCSSRYSSVICRPIAMQFLNDNSFAILETRIEEEDNILKLVVIDEKHYKLVNRDDLSHEEIKNYRKLSNDVT